MPVRPYFSGMNKPQKSALLKVLMARDYVLIKGYPGTGATSQDSPALTIHPKYVVVCIFQAKHPQSCDS